MKIIVGLGNIGRRYDLTPHNVGFDVADQLSHRWSLAFRETARYKAELAEGQIAGTPVILVKPSTFMNLSGEAVAPLVRQRELADDDLLVIADDVALPIGRLRIRSEGSHGGHNGLRSLIERLGHDRFARLRVGIRPPWEVENLVEFVLRRLPPLEQNQLREMAEHTADAVESWVREGVGLTADKFNGKRWFGESGRAVAS